MLRAGRLRLHILSRQASSSSTIHGAQDHYTTLGINKNASAKEIKSAFYELSKKYHPDRNPKDKENASVKFQSIVTAYEILGNSDKRKVYDEQLMPPRHQRLGAVRRNMDLHTKKYTDLDIDFKDFEQFQRMARRRKNSATFTYEDSDEFLKKVAQYKSSLAADRDKEERRIREELEEKKRQSKYRTPTFEQLLQHERMRKERQFKSNMRMGICALLIVGCLFILSGGRR